MQLNVKYAVKRVTKYIFNIKNMQAFCQAACTLSTTRLEFRKHALGPRKRALVTCMTQLTKKSYFWAPMGAYKPLVPECLRARKRAQNQTDFGMATR